MNPQAVTVGARLVRKMAPVIDLAIAQSPDRVSFCGGLLAGIIGRVSGNIGPLATGEHLRLLLGRLDGQPQLELPAGVRLAIAAAEQGVAANDEAPIAAALARVNDEQLEAMRRVLAVVAAKAGIESDKLVELLDIAIEEVRAGRPPAPIGAS
jgi:hypothetical protein